MRVGKFLLATTAMALAFSATPTLASANPIVDNGGPFTVHSGATQFNVPPFYIQCTTVTGTGTFTSSTSGAIQLTSHGCKAISPPISCTSTGQPAGTITTTALTFHLKTTPSGNPAMLITTNAGHYASFVCGLGWSFVVNGNGLIGEITAPGYGEASSTATTVFNQIAEGVQEHTTVAGSETEYGLEVTFGGEAPRPFGVNSTQMLSFTEGPATLTEE